MQIRAAGRKLGAWVADHRLGRRGWLIVAVLSMLTLVWYGLQVGGVTATIWDKEGNFEWFGAWWAAATTLIGVAYGALGNELHRRICARAGDRRCRPDKLLRNHDLTRAVGEAMRALLLDAADPARGDPYALKLQESTRAWLRSRATGAPEKWAIVVTWMEKRAGTDWDSLREATLWKFIERSDAPNLTPEAWYAMLAWIGEGTSLPFAADDPDGKAVIGRLTSWFGKSLWEVIKNDYVGEGFAAEALHLVVYAELLKRTQQQLDGNKQLSESMDRMRRAWQNAQASIRSELEKLGDQGRATQRHLQEIGNQLVVLDKKVDLVIGSTGRILEEMHGGVYIWQAPVRDALSPSADIPIGGKVTPHLFSRGCYFRQQKLQTELLSFAKAWIDKTFSSPEGPVSPAVLWIEGPSGAGKSVAMVHLLADLFGAGHRVLWLGTNPLLIDRAVAMAKETASPSGTPTIIAIDDAYPPAKGEREHWESAAALLNDVAASGDFTRMPLFICCGPSEHLHRFRRETQVSEVSTFRIGPLDQNAARDLLHWYAERIGIPIAAMSSGSGTGELPVLLLWKWRCGEQHDRQFSNFLRGFLRNRLGRDKGPDNIRDLFRAMLLLNCLDVDLPSEFQAELGEEAKKQLRSLTADLHIQVGPSENDEIEVGLRLAHTQIAHRLYQEWSEVESLDAQELADHFAATCERCLRLSLQSDRLAPIEGIAAALESGGSIPGLPDDISVRIAIQRVWGAWWEHLTVRANRTDKVLDAWLRIARVLEDRGITLSPSPLAVVLEQLGQMEVWSPLVTELCQTIAHFGRHGHAASISGVLVNVLDRIEGDLKTMAPTEEWFGKWRLGIELERALRVHGSELARFPSLGWEWLERNGHLPIAASVWERSPAIGLLGLSTERLSSFAAGLSAWLAANHEHERWLPIWKNGARWQRHLRGADFNGLFEQHVRLTLTDVDDETMFAARFFQLCRWGWDRKRRHTAARVALSNLHEQGLRWADVRPRSPHTCVSVVRSILDSLDGSSRRDGSHLLKVAQQCLASIEAAELPENTDPIWKHGWFNLLDAAGLCNTAAREEALKRGLDRLQRVGMTDTDWPHLAQKLLLNSELLSSELRQDLLRQCEQWLSGADQHPGWNYVLGAVLKMVWDDRNSRIDQQAFVSLAMRRLRRDECADDWSYVWQKLHEHIRILEPSDARDLFWLGQAWAINDVRRERPAWVYVYERVITEHNMGARFQSRDKHVRFEVHQSFIEQGLAYARDAWDEQGVDGVLAQLLRSATPASQLVGIGPLLAARMGPDRSDAWQLAAALASRPDDLPKEFTPAQIFSWMLSWLGQERRKGPRDWVFVWRAARTLLPALDAEAQSGLWRVCMAHVKTLKVADPELLSSLLNGWHRLTPGERKELDAYLAVVRVQLPRQREAESWAGNWKCLARRMKLDESLPGLTASWLISEAQQWLGVAVSSNFHGLPATWARLISLTTEHRGRLVSDAAGAITLLPPAEQAMQWVKLVRRCADMLSDADLLVLFRARVQSFEKGGFGESALMVWGSMWTFRNRLSPLVGENRLAEWIAEILTEVPVHKRDRAIKDVMERISDTPATAVLGSVGGLVRQWAKEAGIKAQVFLGILFEHERVLLGDAAFAAALVEAVEALKRHVGERSYGATLATVLAAVERRRDITSQTAEPARELDELLLNGFLSEASTNWKQWWLALRVARQRRPDSLDRQRVERRALRELAARRKDPTPWADVWCEIVADPAALLDTANQTQLLEEGLQWLHRHPTSSAWPRVLEAVLKTESVLPGRVNAKAIEAMAVERLRACSAMHRDWPPIWTAVASLGMTNELEQIARRRLKLSPFELRGWGRVLGTLFRQHPTDPVLRAHAKRYIEEIDPDEHPLSYRELKSLLELAGVEPHAADDEST